MRQECAPSRSWRAALARLLRRTSGNVAMITALALPVVIGAFGVGAEAASWMTARKSLQNAADAAAIAAATEAGSNYTSEARAVAAQYSLQDGVDGVTVAVSDTGVCPAGVTGTCYRVTITKPQPLLLAQVVGYTGDSTFNGSPAKMIGAEATAVQGIAPRPYCVLALGTSGTDPALRTNGAPKANLAGCNVMSNTGADCNGHDLGADVGDAHDANNGCGIVKHSNVPKVSDPYSGLASNIPANTCATYPQEPVRKKDPPLTGDNAPSGIVGWADNTKICGDVQLAGDVIIGADTTLIIYNGSLDLNGHSLQTSDGVHLTIVFAGDNAHDHIITGDGTMDFPAPTDGPWSGMAIYQAPNLRSGVDITESGNSPTWNITGMGYFPHASLTLSGAINKSSHGASCVGLVADNVLINGTGSILAHGECEEAGLTLPTGPALGRGKLVS
jgi:hypothetical protein